MVSDVKVDDEVLQKAVEAFESHSHDYKGICVGLQAEIEGTEDIWKGPASTAYRAAGAQWAEDARKTSELLAEIYDKVQQSRAVYKSTEERRAASLTAFQAQQ